MMANTRSRCPRSSQSLIAPTTSAASISRKSGITLPKSPSTAATRAATNRLLIGGCLLLTLLSVATLAMGMPQQEAPAATQNAEEFPEEDGDMLMEPNDFTPITVLRSQEQHFHMPPSTQLQPRQFQAPIQQEPEQEQFRPIANPNTKVALVARSDVGADSHSQAAQNFYPPFYHEAPPLGHSRPYFGHGHGTVSESTPLSLPLPLLAPGQHPQQQQQQQVPVQPLPHPHPHPQQQSQVHPQQRNFDASILGSGDFGVLRGGTFYPEEEMPYHPEDNSDYIYGDANNGHGRPSEGFVQKYTYPEEQFANFRDFADINTPADSAFSQFVVVYAAKNATAPSTHPHPKNIFEQLELLDREKALEEESARQKQSPGKYAGKAKITSKSKSKLAKTKLQKKYRKKASPKADPLELEPLLALS
ncbi:developmental regulatory protein wetA isoform X1 [Drosophila subobscura]|uniref:developmental regulatory protein wetA isoform X1 n=1 Tax=Drosophila subobscura TaxID=7241 RepID=UPI00155A768F|nr:developmental regulatory protein wetA isoform X1 [Drosophila subobscura]XP_034669307.1 developmental regulatory protein wetA isoform X1 [Drosophila subobscura]